MRAFEFVEERGAVRRAPPLFVEDESLILAPGIPS